MHLTEIPKNANWASSAWSLKYKDFCNSTNA